MQCAASARPTRNHCCRCFARPQKFAGCWSSRDTCENRFCLFWKAVPRSPTTWYARPVELDVGASVLARARVNTNHAGTDVLGSPVERSSTPFLPRAKQRSVAPLDSRGGCPHVVYGAYRGPSTPPCDSRANRMTPLRMTIRRGQGLAHDQYFANVIAGQKKFDGCEIAEEILDIAVVEHALQAEFAAPTSLFPVAASDVLHLQCVPAHDVVAVARCIGARLLGVEKGQQHASGFEQRPEPADHWLHQTFVQIIGQVPAQDNIELCPRIHQVFFQEAFAVEGRFACLIFDSE